MILIVHILAGGLIASKTAPLLFGLILAFLSHYFLDSLPHKDYPIKNIRNRNWKQTKKEFFFVFLDLGTAIILLYFLSKNFWLALAGGFFGALPDGLDLLYRIFPNKFLAKHQTLHQKINNLNEKLPVFWGILFEFLILIVVIYSLSI